MNDPDKIKEILKIARSNSEDVKDPVIHDALKALESDPELKAWYAQEQEFDAHISRDLHDIQPPANLKNDILKQCLPILEQKKTTSLSVVIKEYFRRVGDGIFWSFDSMGSFAMAASFLIVLGVTVLFVDPLTTDADDHHETYVQAMAHHTKKDDSSKDNQDLKELSLYLLGNKLPTPEVDSIPKELRDSLTNAEIAYIEMDWEEIPVTALSFESKGQQFHLYVSDHKNFPNLKPLTVPIFKQIGTHAVMSYTSQGKVYTLVIEGHLDDLQSLSL